jgi:hypothetical protein
VLVICVVVGVSIGLTTTLVLAIVALGIRMQLSSVSGTRGGALPSGTISALLVAVLTGLLSAAGVGLAIVLLPVPFAVLVAVCFGGAVALSSAGYRRFLLSSRANPPFSPRMLVVLVLLLVTGLLSIIVGYGVVGRR